MSSEPEQPASAAAFDQNRASSYTAQYARLAPLSDAIHLLMRLILGDLPERARVLCIGAGTGAEILYLAREFPHWQFTAVEPAAPMLKICRTRAEEQGIAARCAFHGEYLDTLPDTEPFDAATCLLVTHFLLQPESQGALFAKIAARLRPQGTLITSAIASDMSMPAYENLLAIWLHMQIYTGTSPDAVAQMPAGYGRDIAVLPPAQIASLIAANGFEPPVPFYQALLIHAWYARSAAPSAH